MSETYNGWTHKEILEKLSDVVSEMDEHENYEMGDELYDILTALKVEWGIFPDERHRFCSKIRRKALRLIDDKIDALFLQLQTENKIKSGDISPSDECELEDIKWYLANVVANTIAYEKYIWEGDENE